MALSLSTIQIILLAYLFLLFVNYHDGGSLRKTQVVLLPLMLCLHLLNVSHLRQGLIPVGFEGDGLLAERKHKED